MKIILTASEILDRGRWDEFCEMRGLNPWALNEGLMECSREFTLSPEEARELFGEITLKMRKVDDGS